jgi:HK97 gp10 family phage protein
MQGITLSVRGDKAIMRRLKELPRNLRKRALQTAARTAMKPVLAAARSGLPTASGALRKAIKSKSWPKNRKGLVGQRVVISDRWFVGDEFYGAFQEFGWKTGKRQSSKDKQVKERKQILGKHFIEAAFQTKGETAMRTFLTEVPKAIEKVLATEANKK